MPSNARVAVIGSGWWATQAHIPGLLANPDATLVAICDADPARLQAAASAYRVERT
jgi:predicted dehydrogenase